MSLYWGFNSIVWLTVKPINRKEWRVNLYTQQVVNTIILSKYGALNLEEKTNLTRWVSRYYLKSVCVSDGYLHKYREGKIIIDNSVNFHWICKIRRQTGQFIFSIVWSTSKQCQHVGAPSHILSSPNPESPDPEFFTSKSKVV